MIREIWHYAMQYRADGAVTIQHNAEGHWKRMALLEQWPVAQTAKWKDEYDETRNP